MGIGRQADDLLRKRIDDVVSKTSRGAEVADGEWLDPEIEFPMGYRPPRAASRIEDIGEVLRPGFEALAELRSNVNPPDGPLDDLLRAIDRRSDIGTSPIDFPLAAPHDRGPREIFGDGVPERDELFRRAFDPSHTPRRFESEEPATSDDRSPLAALERNPAFLPFAGGIDAAREEGPWRPAIGPVGPVATSLIDQSELMRAMLGRDLRSDAAGEPLQHGLEPRDGEGANPLDSIARQLDDLAREVRQRESGATNDEIAAFKHRLTELARETAIEAERKLLDGGDCRREVRNSELLRTASHDSVPSDDYRHRLPEIGACRDDDRRDSADRPRFDAMPDDLCRTAAVEPDFSSILNSMRPQRLEPQAPSSDVDARREDEAGPSKEERFAAVVSDRWTASAPNEQADDRPPAPVDRRTATNLDDDRPPMASGHRRRPSKKARPKSAIAPIVRACLAAVLAIAILVPGAYFARSRMAVEPAASPTIVHERAPIRMVADTGPLTIMPANTVARFQDLVFQLPHLYGIYAINSGRLFELQALPGQAPDPRIAVSAPIPRPSHVMLPDGRVAFLLFRRDMATNISERVAVRIVAKIKRGTGDAAAEPGVGGADDAWTIRNIAVDFRVAPVEHNKEMVLLVADKPDFTFPAGRYALILKGQAYDFTVAGPITDRAQCLERVEAANGSFFHECEVPQAVAKPSDPDARPLAPRSAPHSRRQAELQVRAEDRMTTVGKSR